MSTPNEIRIRKNRQAWRGHGWTATPNALLLRSDISWDAKGAFGWLSLAADDPEFEITARSLAAAGPKGRDHAEKLVRELEQHGYLTRHRLPDPDGTPVQHYELYPLPIDDEHNTYVPSTAKKRDRSKSASSQRKSQSLTGQGLGTAQGDVDNSERPAAATEEPSAEEGSVSPAQVPIPDRPGTGAPGTGAPGTLTSLSRKTSSSLGSSTTGTEVAGSEEEDEDVEGQEQARALLVEHARFQPGRFLAPEARSECEVLLAQHLTAGWNAQRLGRYLREWSAQAFNPSTWLPRQLRELGSPPAARRQSQQTAAGEAPQHSAPASDEARAAARALYPDTRPAGATSRPPRWKQRLQNNRTDRDPERALTDLDDLLGGDSSTA